MFNNIDMSDLSKVINQVQEQMQNVDLGEVMGSDKLFEAKSGGGLVAVSMKGNFEIVDLEIDESLLDDKEALQILVMSALNEVIKMVIGDKTKASSELMKNFMQNPTT